MPTRRKRFSALKRVRRMTAPAAAYEAWDDAVGTRPRTPRPAGSRPGGYSIKQIRPFGTDDDLLVRVRVSRRADTNVGSLIGTRAADPTAEARPLSNLLPAKAIIFIGTGSTVSTTSEITNLSYEKRQGASYTHPFGGNTLTEKEFEAQQIIVTAVAGTPNRSVSFTPERLFAAI